MKDSRPGDQHLDGLRQIRVGARPVRPVDRSGRTWFQRLVLTGGVLATVMSLLSAGVLAWGWSKFSTITQIELALSAPPGGEPENWLLVGTDSREGIDPDDPNAGVFLGEPVVGKRTDTMMVARVDPGAGRVDLLSIPRDLWVPLAGSDETGRINSAFNGEGGEQRLIDTIESYLGIELHHYAEVNFVGFQDLVDALDGVPMWFDAPMRDAGSGLAIETAGCHVLDGFQALAFARGRNLEYEQDGRWLTDPSGDLGRMSRQQYFVRRVVDRTRSKLNLTDLATIDRVLDVAGRNLTIDRGASPTDLVRLGRNVASLQGDQIVGHSLPVDNHVTNGGAQVLRLQVDAAQPILDIFRGVVPDPVAPGTVVVTVWNGSGVQGQARLVSEALTAAGFDVQPPETADQPAGSTEIRYAPGLLAQADRVARQLDGPARLIEDPEASGVTLVTGSDFGTVATQATPYDAEAFAALSPTTLVPRDEPETPPVVSVPDQADPVGRLPGPSPDGTACA